MSRDFGLIQYDDGTFHCTEQLNIKPSSMGGYILKSKSCWYGAKLLYTGSQKLCQSLYLSLTQKQPRVEIQNILDNYGKGWLKWENMEAPKNSEKQTENSHENFFASENIEELDNSDDDPDYGMESSISSSSDLQEDILNAKEILFNENLTPQVTNKIPNTPKQNNTELDNYDANPDCEVETKSSINNVSDKTHFNKDSTLPVAKSPNSVLLFNSNTFSPVVIDTITPSGRGKSKKYFCFFCKTLVTKFGRHILLHHENESQEHCVPTANKRLWYLATPLML